MCDKITIMSARFAIGWLLIMMLINDKATATTDSDFLYGTFPKGFMWGASVSAGQGEGAWNEDGRGPSIWDAFSQIPGNIVDGSTPSIACDQYHHWQEDIKLAKNLGLSHYRFSISWSRVMSDGTLDTINELGLQYYDKLINGLLKAGIQPMVTLHHDDLPNALQEKYGGWLSRQIIPLYADYARLMFQRFGDRVKWWSTINEINIFAQYAYGIYGSAAPGILTWPDTASYNVTQISLLAHAAAYHVYDNEFRSKQKGKIGITIEMDWIEPADPTNQDDQEAAERQRQLFVGLIAHPIFSQQGDWPEVMKRVVAEKSAEQGYPASRLPAFTDEEIASLRGSADYFSLNQYSTEVYKYQQQPLTPVLYLNDVDAVEVAGNPNWPQSGAGWLVGVPWGMRKVLNWIKDQYNNPEVIITENGYSELNPPQIHDEARISWLTDYIDNVLKAIVIDGCNVKAYTIWSFMDDFEWSGGYTQCFGLINVNFTDPARKRTPKDSYYWYKQLIKDNGFPEEP